MPVSNGEKIQTRNCHLRKNLIKFKFHFLYFLYDIRVLNLDRKISTNYNNEKTISVKIKTLPVAAEPTFVVQGKIISYMYVLEDLPML